MSSRNFSDNSSPSPSHETADSEFSAQSLSVRVQKKFATKISSKRLVKVFVDESMGRLFDEVNSVIRQYTGSKHKAQKIMKYVVTINMKLAILYWNELLSNAEKEIVVELYEKLHSIAEAMIKYLYRNVTQVDVSLISDLVRECEQLLLQITARHLKERSKQKIHEVANLFADVNFLKTVFEKPPKSYGSRMNQITNEVQTLVDRGIL